MPFFHFHWPFNVTILAIAARTSIHYIGSGGCTQRFLQICLTP